MIHSGAADHAIPILSSRLIHSLKWDARLVAMDRHPDLVTGTDDECAIAGTGPDQTEDLRGGAVLVDRHDKSW